MAASAVVVGGIAMLLIAADEKKGLRVCAGVQIKITTKSMENYVNKDEVLFAMEKSNKRALKNQPVQNIDLPKLEKMLESEHWIKDAQLYFDSKNVLNVLVQERTPMARVITLSGNSFYIDEEGKQLPLIEDKVVRLQTITGFIAAKKWNSSDSALFNNVKQVVQYISGHQFWNAQIGQIDITPQNNIELIPVVGDHIIKLGRGENVEARLRHLLLFYQQVLAQTGFSKYAAIDLRFENQVVAVKKQKISAVDSIAFQHKVAEIMKKAESMQMVTEEDLAKENEEKKSVEMKTEDKPSVPVKTKPNPIAKPQPVQKTLQPKSVVKEKVEVVKTAEQNAPRPKAVMPKQEKNNNPLNN